MEIYMNELTTESPYELHKDLKFIKEIDHGAFGKVINVHDLKKNLDLAIKVINKSGANAQLIKQMKEEIFILKKLNHENIVKFYGCSETNNQLLIKMEYIKYGTLSQWMRNNQKISEEQASLIIGKVLSAVEYIHSMHICHRDIKPENIMISKENDLSSIKIIDFGLSAHHFNYLSNNEYCGTFIYMAPEQIEKKLYYFSVDIWSIGILMYMLLNNGKHPFYQKHDKKSDFINKIRSAKLHFINKISFMAKNLNYKLCEPNPSWRYSANLAIKHPWITRNPKDEIPLTFNEILNKNNSKKNASAMIMISIFLNYYKKIDVKNRNNELLFSNNNGYNFDNFIKRKKTKNKLFIISNDYIDKCNKISKTEKEKLLKKKEKYLEVLSTDEEEPQEKETKKAISDNCITSKLTFNKKTKNLKISEKYISPEKKKYFIKESNRDYNSGNKYSNNFYKNFNKENFATNDNKEPSFPITRKASIKERPKLYLSSIPNNNQYKYQNSDEMNNKAGNYNKNMNLNQINNIKNRGRAKSKSISKFYLTNNNSSEDMNEVENNKCMNQVTPEKNKKYAVKSNLPYVTGIGNYNKNSVNTTGRKLLNNYIGKYNIIPLVLPFIGGKQEEKRKNIMI
jgi:serine/threonine protein kinase